MLHKEAELNRHTKILSFFRNNLEAGSRMTDEEWEATRSKFSFRTAARNTLLLEHGNVEHSVRFIVEGVIRIIHYDVEPYVFDFRTGCDFLCDSRSLLKQQKSTFTFETITKCEWIQLDSADCMDLIRQNNMLRISMLMKIAEYAQRAHERAALIRNSTAEERYRMFCRSHPEVVRYAKIRDIASYLSITPQSLSRIRKNFI